MHVDKFLELHKELCEEARGLSARKGHDYSGANDTLKNLRLVEAAGLCTAEQGVLVRLLDKLSRAVELDKPGNSAEVADESLHDTMLDIVNYALLHEALRADRSRRGCKLEDEATQHASGGTKEVQPPFTDLHTVAPDVGDPGTFSLWSHPASSGVDARNNQLLGRDE